MKNRSKLQRSRILLVIILWGQLILFSGQSKQVEKIDNHGKENNQFIIVNNNNESNEHFEAIRVLGW